MTTVYEEDKKLANDVLERNYYTKMRKGQGMLEIFLLGTCKSNCDYCYLKKHQSELFPINLYNEDVIIHNLELIIDWYIKNQFTCIIEIFSGEWLTLPIANRVFDVFYDKFSAISSNKRPKAITNADNMQFLKNEKATKDFEYNVSRLNSLGIDFGLSASIDGKECDYGRTENSDEYYANLATFLEKYGWTIHPMISSDNIKYWIKNYRWWRENFPPYISWDPMTLEVRDNNWNEDSINELLRYCDFLIDTKWDDLNHDKNEMLRYALGLDTVNYPWGKAPFKVSYNIIGFNRGIETCSNRDVPSCTVSKALMIRAGDLICAPCHRTCYSELYYGKFNVNEDNTAITDFDPQNVALLIGYTNMKRSCLPHCENCKFQAICVGHCHGVSWEEYRNPLVPPLTVCNMYKAKLSFLIYKYNLLGIFDEMPNIKHLISNNYYEYLMDLIQDIVGGLNGE